MSVEIPCPDLKGKNWLAKGLLQALIIALTIIAYSSIQRAVKPDHPEPMNESFVLKQIQDTVSINSGRILRLETLMEQLRPMPEALAGTKATMDAVKNTVDKIEKNLQSHVDKN